MPGYFYDNETICHLDTCGCVIAWNDDLMPDEEAHRLSGKLAVRCDMHSQPGALAVTSDAMDIHSENISKNVAATALVSSLPDASFANANIPELKQLKVQPEFYIDPIDRTLTIYHPDLTPEIAAAVSTTMEDHSLVDLRLVDG